MQFFPSTVLICISSAKSLFFFFFFSNDPYHHFPSHQIVSYGPTVDLVSVEDVTLPNNLTQRTAHKLITHTPHMSCVQDDICKRNGCIKIIITIYPQCRNHSDSKWVMIYLACLIITGGAKGILVFQPVFSNMSRYTASNSLKFF